MDYFLKYGVTIIIVALWLCTGWHILTPEQWHWLDQVQVDHLREITIATALIFMAFNKEIIAGLKRG